ncbi:hypothetical protein NQZ68_040278 [Dissostichus eleginoides]|nr:hypothetical protein NQZ68_040278 [Dissostichus eleginoides]
MEDATCGGLGPIFHPPRSLLALYNQSHHCSRRVMTQGPCLFQGTDVPPTRNSCTLYHNGLVGDSGLAAD